MRSPISVWRRMNAHSSGGQRAGLGEDPVRDRDLADVVQLAGVADALDLLDGQAEPARGALGELGDAR